MDRFSEFFGNSDMIARVNFGNIAVNQPITYLRRGQSNQ